MVRRGGGGDGQGGGGGVGNIHAIAQPAIGGSGGIAQRYREGGGLALVDHLRGWLGSEGGGGPGAGGEPGLVVGGEGGGGKGFGVERYFVDAAGEGFEATRGGGSDECGQVKSFAESLGDGSQAEAVVVEGGLAAAADYREVHQAAQGGCGEGPGGGG